MKYLSVCSGIEAATVAWHPLGWTPFAFAEIEPFPCAVLAHHYPRVPNHGDMNGFKGWPDANLDVLVGGTPCQSFSVAGLRKGLSDPRGNLALTFLGIADRYRPEWVIWENVPGVLSQDDGRAFGSIIGGLAELGYGWAYRVLDAQFIRVDGFGRAVPQRRRRVFVVGCSGGWRRAGAVLFEPESLSGDPPPRRQAGEGIAPTISARPTGGGGLGTDFDCDGGLLAFGGNNTAGPIEVATACQAHGGPAGRINFESETFVVGAMQGDGTPNGHGTAGINSQLVDAGYVIPVAASLTCGAESSGKGGYAGRRQEDDVNLIAFAQNSRDEVRLVGGDGGVVGALAAEPGMKQQSYVAFAINSHAGAADGEVTNNSHAAGGPVGLGIQEGCAYSLRSERTQSVAAGWAVRRLTPLECERLQGFPDGYTVVPFRNKPAADGPRYKALGNSMAVNAMRWLGRRIELVALTTGERRE